MSITHVMLFHQNYCAKFYRATESPFPACVHVCKMCMFGNGDVQTCVHVEAGDQAWAPFSRSCAPGFLTGTWHHLGCVD